MTIAQAAAQGGADRSTVIQVRQVPGRGALAALAASKPGSAGKSQGDIG